MFSQCSPVNSGVMQYNRQTDACSVNDFIIEKSARIHLEIVYFYVRAMLSVFGILIIDIRKEQQDGKENVEKCKLKILDNQEEKS